MWIIYRLYCEPTGLSYIGLTKNGLGIRWAQHCSEAKRRRLPRNPLHQAIRSHGAQAFDRAVLCTTNVRELAYSTETEKIRTLGTLWPDGYNRNTGGFDGQPDAEVLDRMRQAARARGPMSPEAIEKMRATKRGKPAHPNALKALEIGRALRNPSVAHLSPVERIERRRRQILDYHRRRNAARAIAAGRQPGRIGRPPTLHLSAEERRERIREQNRAYRRRLARAIVSFEPSAA